jgi:hypothetical protein
MKDIPADVMERAREIALRYSGYANTPLVELIVPALLEARAEGERRGIERAAEVASQACLVPPDGGSPTKDEADLCNEIAAQTRALPVPEPAKEKA